MLPAILLNQKQIFFESFTSTDFTVGVVLVTLQGDTNGSNIRMVSNLKNKETLLSNLSLELSWQFGQYLN
jgi:hypothetical protein